jgi:hypothetical protein
MKIKEVNHFKQFCCTYFHQKSYLTKCSFFQLNVFFQSTVLIGRDLTSTRLETLMFLVRDAFLFYPEMTPVAKISLLKLIELHAADWQLPVDVILQYFTNKC